MREIARAADAALAGQGTTHMCRLRGSRACAQGWQRPHSVRVPQRHGCAYPHSPARVSRLPRVSPRRDLQPDSLESLRQRLSALCDSRIRSYRSVFYVERCGQFRELFACANPVICWYSFHHDTRPAGGGDALVTAKVLLNAHLRHNR